MQLILKKTLLSKKPSPQSVLMALFSYLILLLAFIINDRDLVANGYDVYEKGEYWKAFTTSLMHGDFVHLGSNTLFFVAFSMLLNSYFGFWIFPVLSFIVGGIVNLIALKIYDPQIYLVGISGVIYFMAAFWMTMFVSLERHMTLYKRLMITTGVSLILFFPELFVKNNVSYLAHGLGFGIGIIFGALYFKFNRSELRSHEVWIERHPDPDAYILEELSLQYPEDSDSSKGQTLHYAANSGGITNGIDN
ncbi:MAG: rhomboid family intramembrane serine protease [Bdellovibrionales bacterium]|nr:rhomboid family intramembrane serine protease [Bdellovibrionales bacterium]